MVRGWSVAAGALALVLLATAAGAVTRTVPAQFAKIQAAVDACSNGDVVVVSPGRYEDFRFRGKAITVRSTNPTNPAVVAATVLDGNLHLTLNVVSFEQSEGRGSILSGFRIYAGEHGVYCRASSPTVTNCVIDGSASIAIVVSESGSPLIYKNRITGDPLNPAVICGGTSSPIIRRNTLVHNSHGAIDCGAACVPLIEDNVINANRGISDAAVVCYGGTIRRNQICNNSGWAGGIRCYGNASLCYNLIAGNTAEEAGGGIWCSGNASIVSNTICDNLGDPSKGGNICVAAGSPLIKNNIIAYAKAGGGLINTGTGRPRVSYCDVFGNVGADYSGPMALGAGLISKNPALNRGGGGDYRLKSTAGRWTTDGWVLDTVSSPCLDRGDPASPFAAEPAPNGGRLNLGYDGNTAYASKSVTVRSAGAPAVIVAAAQTAGGGAQLCVNVSRATTVQVTILNLAGRTVASLPAEDLPAGMNALLWNGRGTTGAKVPAGSYMARLTARDAQGAQAQTLVALAVGR